MTDHQRNSEALQWLQTVVADRAVLLGEDASRRARELAVGLSQDDGSGLAEAHPVAFALGWFHWQRAFALPAERAGDDLAAAVRHLGGVFLVKPDVVPERLRSLFERAGHGGDPANVDPTGLTHHGLEIFNQYLRTRQPRLLVQAILLFRVVLAAAAEDHPYRAWYLGNLGYALRKQDEQTPDTATLAEAVLYLGLALAVAAPDHSDTYQVATELGISQLMLSQRTEDDSILRESVRTLRVALAAIPEGSPQRVAALINLAGALRQSATPYQGIPDAVPAREAVQLMREVVDLLPADHPHHAMHLGSLGDYLRTLAKFTGRVDTMSEAVAVGRAALAAIPRNDHQWFALALQWLRDTQLELFRQTEETAMLRDAARTACDLAAVTPAAHPDRARNLCNAGVFLHDAFQETRDVSLLREAVEAGRGAVAACSEGSPAYALCQSNLGIFYRLLHEETGERSALMEAAYAAHAAKNAVAADRPEYARYLSNLGTVLVELASVISDDTLARGVLEEAVQNVRTALVATAADSPEHAFRVAALGLSIRSLLRFDADPALRAEAKACFSAAVEREASATIDRITAYRYVAELATRPDEAQDKLQALEAAIGLVELLAPVRLPWKDREIRVGRLAGLAGEAAEAALDAGRPARAVELLEQARGILVAESLGLRGGEHQRLRARAPVLAARLDAVRARLDDAEPADSPRTLTAEIFGSGQVPEGDLGRIADRRAAYAEWQRLLTDIRALPGFEGFLRAPSIEELTRYARDEPIVIVTSGRSRCDALILTGEPADPVRVVPLRGVAVEDIGANVTRLVGACGGLAGRDLAGSRAEGAEEILPVLSWLWDNVAEPVLAALGHTGARRDDGEWPRIRWCLVGAFAFLPLHAAGRHVGRETAAVLDRVVSSYTATVRALADSRPANGSEDAGLGPALVVSVPATPGAPLPGAAAEADAIRALIPDARILPDATRDVVLEALPGHRIVHFACHGRADWGDPRRGHLVLMDHEREPLSIADISALQLHAGLAYLSACDTAATPRRLVDEAVHLTSAFHLAGYQHVIGTLWPIDDAVAARFAADFYTHLTDGGTVAPRIDGCALALHRATRRLRELNPADPLLWAAYTHTGP